MFTIIKFRGLTKFYILELITFTMYNSGMVRNITKAMVMSAGLGSRLEPITLQVPKPLVSVLNRPLADILFEKLVSVGIKDVICNTYYLSEQIINRYKTNSLGINFNYVNETALSGTAGGLKKCQFFFNEGEDFVVLSGDGLTNADIEHGIEVHQKSGAVATIGVKPVSYQEVSNFGVVVADAQGYITEFQEKPPVELAKSNCINTGIYIFNYKIFDFIPYNEFYDFAKDVFPKLVKLRQINVFEVSEYWSDVGTVESYKNTVQDVFAGKCLFNHSDIIRTSEGAYVSDSIVPEGTRFSGNSTIGKNCVIGNNVIIEDSIILDDVNIADNTCISNSIICSNSLVKGFVSDEIVFMQNRKDAYEQTPN